jgi:hypothetical protein
MKLHQAQITVGRKGRFPENSENVRNRKPENPKYRWSASCGVMVSGLGSEGLNGMACAKEQYSPRRGQSRIEKMVTITSSQWHSKSSVALRRREKPLKSVESCVVEI